MKIVLSFSAALIAGVILFFGAWQEKNVALPSGMGAATLGASFAADESLPNSSGGKREEESLTVQGRQELERLRRQRNEAQSKVKSFLSGRPPDLETSLRLLQARRKELLLQKILMLGEANVSPQEMAEAERKRMLSALDREAKILEEQLALLTRIGVRE